MTPRIPTANLLRTKDSGKSWEDITGVLKKGVIEDIAIDPKSPEIIYVASTQGLFKTLNGGKSWGKIWDKGLSRVFLNPESPNEVYVMIREGDLYYSKDGGVNFNNITPTILYYERS